MIMMSACLAGINCKYNGKNNLHPAFKALAENGDVLLVCPEELGGLPVPRSSSEICKGTGEDVLAGRATVINREGNDITRHFIMGAQTAFELGKNQGIDLAILRRRSPSCGCGKIYDGTFTSTMRNGDGVFAALLKRNAINVVSDEEYLEKEYK
ncbi:MAG: DUF523 domain-containing protein [Deltaproteobacteria bacterium]